MLQYPSLPCVKTSKCITIPYQHEFYLLVFPLKSKLKKQNNPDTNQLFYLINLSLISLLFTLTLHIALIVSILMFIISSFYFFFSVNQE